MKNKICILGVYFGNLPNYFNLWLKSCEMNEKIDFLVITDNYVQSIPENVKVINMSFDDVKKLVEKKLEMEVALNRPYKMCDLKVVYGKIFEEYLSDYDYWGHCDFDMIFGDLNHFFEKYNLYSYDRFGALGHLSLFKNVPEVNDRYKMFEGKLDYKTVFSSDENYALDELNGITKLYIDRGFPIFTKRIFADIASMFKRYRVINSYNLDKPAENYNYQIFYWENGKCFCDFFDDNQIKTKEYFYIHFKKRPNFIPEFSVNDAKAFYITQYGFFEKKGKSTLEIIKKYNPYHGALYELLENCKNCINCKFKSLISHFK